MLKEEDPLVLDINGGMQMKFEVDSMIKIENPSKEIKEYCKSFLTLKNPEIQKRKAMRILDWKFKTNNLSLYKKK